MGNPKQYAREANGRRFLLKGGLNTVLPFDLIPEGQYPYLQNVRAYLEGRITGRATTSDPLFTLAAIPHTITRLNDTTPSGPVNGFVRVIGAAGLMYVNAGQIASGFTGNPLSIVINGPDQSVQPWAYIGDSSTDVTIPSYSGYTDVVKGMIKIRSDGLTRKTGIKEPQNPPSVGINTVNVTEWLTLPANTPPWTNIGGINANQNYAGLDNQPPFPTIILTPVGGATVTLTVTGTATVNGAPHAPGDAGPSAPDYPGAFIPSPLIVVFAFTDASGNILAQSAVVGAPPVVGNVGAGATLTVPAGAAQLQIGIDSHGGTFSANSGSYLIEAVVSTSAITEVSSTVGLTTAYIWGDSPHSGPVSEYIWMNPNDVGTGTPRTIGTAAVVATNNSLIFDSDPEDGTVPVQWSTLNSSGTTVGTINLFDPALESNGYQDFNCCIVGSFFFPQGGTYNVQIQNKDQVMFGVGGGATSTGGAVTGPFGQTISVVSGLPLLYVSTPDGEGGAVTHTISVTVPAQGIYPFEFDWDYWDHTGRSLIAEASPTPGAGVAVIPPLPQGVRTNVIYWGVYRASETGAQSNPSPASSVQQTPVLANTVTIPFSTDPQVDKVDYYRQDGGLANPTYVATGPNDGAGPIINGIQYNTEIEDTLSDLAAATNQLMQRDNFEPFPTIGTPLSGNVSIIDGVINWVSGDKFPLNMLPGTLMLIGFPTQNAYSLVARPITNEQIVIPTVPDTIGNAAGDGVPYNISQPILAQQPLPSMWGPDAYGFFHACYDFLRPGTYYWTKAYNPDSAPQTNQLNLASPSETLMNGALVNGISMVFSTQRAWLMYPNFADAQATTEGISGNQWNPILSLSARGLFIRTAICSVGGRAVAFRASDGIFTTSGGPEKEITKGIYNLFPHENFTPIPIIIGTDTIYPPNDSLPQKLTYQNGYIYYDYQDANAIYRTLVYDEAGGGWSVDVGGVAFSAHSGDYAPNVNDTAVGCFDNTVRILESGGTEETFSIVATPAINAGDARALKRVADIFIRAQIEANNAITAAVYGSLYQNLLPGFLPTTLTGAGYLSEYILDPGGSEPQDTLDVELILSWPTSSTNYLDLWQPSLLDLPIAILSRVTEGLSFGLLGYQHAYMANLGYVATAPITLTLNTDEGVVTQTWPASGSLFVPSKIMLKFPPNKFKLCAYQLTSSAPFYLFECEIWLGAWGRANEYKKVNPFNQPGNPEALV